MPIMDLTKSHLVLIYLKIVVSNNSEKEDSTFLLFFLNMLIYCFEEDKDFCKEQMQARLDRCNRRLRFGKMHLSDFV